MEATAVAITVSAAQQVSGLWQRPPDAWACYVMAHGAGAGMQHEFLAAIAAGLAGRGVAVLRYQFPFMERGARRPDAPALAQATVRAAAEEALRRSAGLPLFAGGKSFGARMTSQAQAQAPLAGVRGLVFLGFPLHPAGKPSTDRALHLFDVHIPMLFLQGTRDELADLRLLAPICRDLGGRARIEIVDDGDHSFHVRVRSGRRDADVRAAMVEAIAEWMSAQAPTA
ncbi:MAG TPA: alpha/beta family hydrolase [Candidatus Limnocylindrales bacterium]|nr:alpha/beta family hydrolase [Candidatus Limnocylindrales bacterium]